MAQVRDHPAGYLMKILRVIVFTRRTDGMAFAFGDEGEMLFDWPNRGAIDMQIITKHLSVCCHIEDRWLGRSIGELWNSGMQGIGAELDGFHIVEGGHAIVAVRMKLER